MDSQWEWLVKFSTNSAPLPPTGEHTMKTFCFRKGIFVFQGYQLWPQILHQSVELYCFLQGDGYIQNISVSSQTATHTNLMAQRCSPSHCVNLRNQECNFGTFPHTCQAVTWTWVLGAQLFFSSGLPAQKNRSAVRAVVVPMLIWGELGFWLR